MPFQTGANPGCQEGPLYHRRSDHLWDVTRTALPQQLQQAAHGETLGGVMNYPGQRLFGGRQEGDRVGDILDEGLW